MAMDMTTDLMVDLAQWGFGADSKIEKIYRTAWMIEDTYILKKSDSSDEVAKNIAVSKILREQGIPAMKHIPASSGSDFVLSDDGCYVLMERIEGQHLVDIFEGDYEDIGAESGRIIGRLHRALRECQSAMSFQENSLCQEMTGWIRDFFEEDGYSAVTREEFQALCDTLSGYETMLPRQLIHRDIHFGNLLFQDGQLTGYIDFDLSQINIRIFDLCYFCLGSLIDVVGDEETVSRWIAFTRNVFAGYGETVPLLPQETEAATCVMKCIELLFVAYFGQNGIGELAQNALEMYHLICRREVELASAIESSLGHSRRGNLEDHSDADR